MEKSRGEMMNSKFMRYFFLLLVLAFFTVDLSGQITRTPDKVVNKPRLFTKTISQKQDNSLPASVADIRSLLDKIIIDGRVGDSYRIPFHGSFLQVMIKAREVKNEHVVAMSMEIVNYQRAWMNISRITDSNQVSYSGTAYHPEYSDALVLKNVNEKYYFEPLDQQKNLITD